VWWNISKLKRDLLGLNVYAASEFLSRWCDTVRRIPNAQALSCQSFHLQLRSSHSTSSSSADSPTPPSINSVLSLPAHTPIFFATLSPSYSLPPPARTGSTISWQLLLLWGLLVYSFSFVAFYFSVYFLIPCDGLSWLLPALERTLN